MRDSGHGNLFYGDSRWTTIWLRSGIIFLMGHGAWEGEVGEL